LFSTVVAWETLPQLVEGGVGEVEPAVADRQAAIGIIDNSNSLAAQFARHLGSGRNRTLSYCKVKLLETVRPTDLTDVWTKTGLPAARCVPRQR
jgi:hypothetical protein